MLHSPIPIINVQFNQNARHANRNASTAGTVGTGLGLVNLSPDLTLVYASGL